MNLESPTPDVGDDERRVLVPATPSLPHEILLDADEHQLLRVAINSQAQRELENALYAETTRLSVDVHKKPAEKQTSTEHGRLSASAGTTMVYCDGCAMTGERSTTECQNHLAEYLIQPSSQKDLQLLGHAVLTGLRVGVGNLQTKNYITDHIPKGTRHANSTALTLFTRFICNAAKEKSNLMKYLTAVNVLVLGT